MLGAVAPVRADGTSTRAGETWVIAAAAFVLGILVFKLAAYIRTKRRQQRSATPEDMQLEDNFVIIVTRKEGVGSSQTKKILEPTRSGGKMPKNFPLQNL